MKTVPVLAYALLLLLPSLSFSASKTLICDPPQGTRVDYFSYNNINLQNDTFMMGRDKISSINPKIVINDNGVDVLFIIGNSAETNSQQQSGNMRVIKSDENQLTFAGVVNDAPILGTYYPKMDVLIYSQQSIWPGPNYQGARAVIFYSKCKQSDGT